MTPSINVYEFEFEFDSDSIKTSTKYSIIHDLGKPHVKRLPDTQPPPNKIFQILLHNFHLKSKES